MIWWTPDPHRKDQAAIVSEPLRSIKQMASYWDFLLVIETGGAYDL